MSEIDSKLVWSVISVGLVFHSSHYCRPESRRFPRLTRQAPPAANRAKGFHNRLPAISCPVP